MRKYTVKPTKKQLKIMKLYWESLQNELKDHYHSIEALAERMSEETGIKNLEFFMNDNEYVGIGDSERTMKLIHSDELEPKKKLKGSSLIRTLKIGKDSISFEDKDV